MVRLLSNWLLPLAVNCWVRYRLVGIVIISETLALAQNWWARKRRGVMCVTEAPGETRRAHITGAPRSPNLAKDSNVPAWRPCAPLSPKYPFSWASAGVPPRHAHKLDYLVSFVASTILTTTTTTAKEGKGRRYWVWIDNSRTRQFNDEAKGKDKKDLRDYLAMTFSFFSFSWGTIPTPNRHPTVTPFLIS